MSDIRLVWDGSGADCAVRLADLEREDDIETAVILSLMLDARARDDDALPDSRRPPAGIGAAGGRTASLRKPREIVPVPASGCFPVKRRFRKF